MKQAILKFSISATEHQKQNVLTNLKKRGVRCIRLLPETKDVELASFYVLSYSADDFKRMFALQDHEAIESVSLAFKKTKAESNDSPL